jgi:hypothetical protein
VPVFELQAGDPGKFQGVGGYKCATCGAGMARQEDIIRADHAALCFERRTNSGGVACGRSVKHELSNGRQQFTDLGQLVCRIGAFFDGGE